MFYNQEGCLPGSDAYYFTPSNMAKNQLFYFISLGHFICDRQYRVIRDSDYGNYLLLLVRRGSVILSTEGREVTVHKGEVGILNCHQPHAYWVDRAADFLWVHFEGVNSADLYRSLLNRAGGNLAIQLENPKKIESIMNDLVLNYRYQKNSTEYEDSLRIYQLLMGVFQEIPGIRHGLDETKDAAINEALYYIREHLSEEMTVGDIAASI